MIKYVIIVAGGSGKRMNSDIPKQFLEINHIPVLMHTINCFLNADNSYQIRIVLPQEEIDRWTGICHKKGYQISGQLIPGGETRFHSVKNGIDGIESDSLVAIHDGVRPLVSEEVIKRCFSLANTYEAVIPVWDIRESLRKIEGLSNKHVDRAMFKIIQTPQVFQGNVILKAYQQNYSPRFTDDASVVESIGYSIHLTEGNRENIKITDAFDLKIATYLLSAME